MPDVMEPQLYSLEFSDHEWEEIESMGFCLFNPTQGKPMYRAEWIAIGHMALGKAQQIDEGRYGEASKAEGFNPEEWADELRGIAGTIFEFF